MKQRAQKELSTVCLNTQTRLSQLQKAIAQDRGGIAGTERVASTLLVETPCASRHTPSIDNPV